MDRKVFLTVPVSLVLRISEGTEVSEVMEAMEITAELPSDCPATIEDISKGDHEIMDSK